MNVLILYFSGTGNTKYVAEQISASLKEQNCNTNVHSIEEQFEINPNEFDMLILGCPKYYEYPAMYFVQYLKKHLPVSNKNIPAMVYCTQMSKTETNFKEIEKILKTKNYKLMVSKSFSIANNMVIFPSIPLASSQVIQENLERFAQILKPILNDFIQGKESKERPNWFMGAIGGLSGHIFTVLFPLFGVKYSASEECIGCGLCAKQCPKQNIRMENKRPKFGKHCIFCMRCINQCPSNSILYNKKQCSQYKRIK